MKKNKQPTTQQPMISNRGHVGKKRASQARKKAFPPIESYRGMKKGLQLMPWNEGVAGGDICGRKKEEESPTGVSTDNTGKER